MALNGTFLNEEENSLETVEEDLHMSYKELIEKIRNIVKIIRRSDAKRKYLLNTTLPLDIKIRWNSLLTMLRAFVRNWSQIKSIILDFELDYFLSEQDKARIMELIQFLVPFEKATSKLSSSSVDFCDIQHIINYLKSKLLEQNTTFAEDTIVEFEKLISRRFNKKLADNFAFLTTGSGDYDFTFLYHDWYRLFRENQKERNISKHNDIQTTQEPTFISLKNIRNEEDELHTFIRAENERIKFETKQKNNKDEDNSIKCFLSELDVIKSTGKRGTMLDLLYGTYKSMKPSTVEVERVFSHGSKIYTLLRKKMSPELMDALIFLRFYLK